jgi:hypothetical protein
MRIDVERCTACSANSSHAHAPLCTRCSGKHGHVFLSAALLIMRGSGSLLSVCVRTLFTFVKEARRISQAVKCYPRYVDIWLQALHIIEMGETHSERRASSLRATLEITKRIPSFRSSSHRQIVTSFYCVTTFTQLQSFEYSQPQLLN